MINTPAEHAQLRRVAADGTGSTLRTVHSTCSGIGFTEVSAIQVMALMLRVLLVAPYITGPFCSETSMSGLKILEVEAAVRIYPSMK